MPSQQKSYLQSALYSFNWTKKPKGFWTWWYSSTVEIFKWLSNPSDSWSPEIPKEKEAMTLASANSDRRSGKLSESHLCKMKSEQWKPSVYGHWKSHRVRWVIKCWSWLLWLQATRNHVKTWHIWITELGESLHLCQNSSSETYSKRNSKQHYHLFLIVILSGLQAHCCVCRGARDSRCDKDFSLTWHKHWSWVHLTDFVHFTHGGRTSDAYRAAFHKPIGDVFGSLCPLFFPVCTLILLASLG